METYQSCYIFRMIFSRQRKNSLIINMGIKYGDMQYTLIEAFQKKVQLILKWNLSWRRSTFFMKKPTIIWQNVCCRFWRYIVYFSILWFCELTHHLLHPFQSNKTRAKFYNLNVEGSSIERIHNAVLLSSHILDDDYLVRVLDILKHPHK